LQDTGEALIAHRARGFSADPIDAYLEYWAVMQAIFVQQDAICELHYAFTGNKDGQRLFRGLPNWNKLRDLRNLTVGHPTNKGAGMNMVLRVSIPRQPMTYDHIDYVVWAPDGKFHKSMNLGHLLDDYDDEAGAKMKDMLEMLMVQLKTTCKK